MSEQSRHLRSGIQDTTAYDVSLGPGAMSRRRLLGIAAGVPLGALLATRAESATFAQQATPALTGQRGGSVTMAVEGDWVGMDPHTNAAFASLFAWEKTYQSLVTYDEQLQIVPALATSWDIPDPLTYIFHLREGVTFHSGDAFTADDVVFWHERLANPDLVVPYRSWFDAVERVEAVDPVTARFTLKFPYSPLLANLASMRGSAMVPRQWAGQVDLNTEASGTGPYKLTNIVPQDSYRWEFNPNYWETGLPYIETADNKLLLEPAARLTAIQTGAAHYTTLPGDLTGQLEGADVNLLMGDKAWYWHLQINCSREPFTDVRVRQAIGLAIDHQEIIDKVLGGFGSLTGPVPTGHSDWYIPVEQLPYKVDLERARALLAEANLADGFKTTYKANSGIREDVATAQIIKERLREINIDVEIIQLDTTRWVSETQPPTSDYDIRLNGNSFYPDADGYLYNHYHSTASFNQVRYSNPAYDELVTNARQLVDHEERRQVYFQAQQMLLDEVPVIPLWNGKNIEALSPRLQGYRQSYTGRRLFFDETWLQS
ncbi:MAG: peptide/nickel transport system substrate-binding protein [Thermomicrobiales bacterium]|nr:peptide/nickel transport system substrate-binding protein [Thermomicrobiales bacterium]MEA2596022.1 peptide/nickel transport system substrate-binding protein [Thermomicrobiales bacterium]